MGRRAGVKTSPENADKLASSQDIGKRTLTMRLSTRLSEMDMAKRQRHKNPERSPFSGRRDLGRADTGP